MKSTFKLLGIIAIAAIIGLAFTACSEDSGPSLDDKLFGKWYMTEAAAEAENDQWVMYDFKDDGTLPWTGGVKFEYEADGELLTGTYEGYDLGSAKYKIEGKKLTLSDAKAGDFGGAVWVTGDYYKK